MTPETAFTSSETFKIVSKTDLGQTDRTDRHTDKQAFLDSYTIGPSGNKLDYTCRAVARRIDNEID